MTDRSYSPTEVASELEAEIVASGGVIEHGFVVASYLDSDGTYSYRWSTIGTPTVAQSLGLVETCKLDMYNTSAESLPP